MVVIFFVGYETSIAIESPKRPHALLNVAGNTILGHILNQLDGVLKDELLLVVTAAQQSAFAPWLAQHYPGLAVQFIVQSESISRGVALKSCTPWLDERNCLLVMGHNIVEADFNQLPANAAQNNATAVWVTDNRNEQSAGIYWLQKGSALASLLDTQSIDQFDDLLDAMQAAGVTVGKLAASFCLDTRSTADYFHANRRLLGLGFGSTDVIERSYADDFTVFPPVFIHETAVVENAVIGPFVNIEAGVIIENSIVKNSFIDANAQIQATVLADSMIGEGARVNGRIHTIILQDNGKFEAN